MDIILASDGSWKECPIAPQEFDSLHQLSLAVSKLTFLDISNLILFLSTGQELSENVFHDIWETNGKSLHGAAFGRQPAIGQSHLEETQPRVQVVVFDRRSFTADPEEWCRSQGVEESLHLERELDAHPAYDATGDPLTPVFSNHAHMHQLSQRIRNQILALRIAGDNLLDHLAGLEDAVLVGQPATGHQEGPVQGGTRRKRRKQSRTHDVRSPMSDSSGSDGELSGSSSSSAASERGSEADVPAQRSWKVLVDAELARERRLLGVSDASTSNHEVGVSSTMVDGPHGTANPGPAAWSGIERDMAIIGRVPVFSCFLPRTSSSRGKGKDKKDGATPDDVVGILPDKWSGKMLGDFVNPGKMRTVSESCKRIYDDHVSRYQSLLSSLSSLRVDAADVTASIEQLIEEVDGEVAALLDFADKDAAEAERLGHEELDVHWESLRSLDARVREQLLALTALKNDFTLHLHIFLHQISVHQSTIASLPPLLSALEDTLMSTRILAKTGFPHLQRLHNMLFAYGSTCIEVLWRKEVHTLLLTDSGTLAEKMAHRLGKELHRREVFEANVLGLLPWTIDVLSSKTDKPSLQVSTRGGADQLTDWAITAEDVKGLIKIIGDLGEGQDENVQGGSEELLRVQSRLARRLRRMYDAVNALRSALGHAGTNTAVSSNGNAQPQSNGDVQGDSLQGDQARSVILAHEQAMTELREQHAAEVSAFQFASQQAAKTLQDAEARKLEIENKLEELEDLRQRVTEQQDQHSQHERDIAYAKERSQQQSVEMEELRRQLQDSKDAHATDLAQMQQLQAERSQLLCGLGDARSSEDQLAAQLLGVQAELTSTLAALEEAQADRDQALRNQSADAEGMIRDHLTEADGDRAVLEHQNLTLAKQIEDLRKQSDSDVTTVRNTLVREADGLKAELGLAKAQLREAQRLRTQLQDQLSQGKDALAHANQETGRQRDIGRDAIRAASAFHDCVSRLHLAIQSSATISGSSLLINKPTGDAVQVPAADQQAQAANEEEPVLDAKDSEDEDEAALLHELAALKTYDLHTFADAVTRTMSLVKKWQKSCKQYRDKARDKLAFSNFAKGDLALFLPTRNSTVNSWAAFNVSSPHNFLKPTRAMEEQTKVRDWIVARIVRIEEMVVDSKRLESNPYQLADGIRFFILHVEEYIPAPPRASRSVSANILDTTAVPPPSTNSLDGVTPMASVSAGTRRTDYFSAPSVPAPSAGLHGAGRIPPTDRRRSSVNDEPFRSLSSRPSTPQEGMLPPPESGALPTRTRRPSSGVYGEPPLLQARQTSNEPRRPPSIASSNGSFRAGIQYASSNKAASTAAVTRTVPDPARIASSSTVPVAADAAQTRGTDHRPLSPSPPIFGALMPGSFRPRLGSQTHSGLGTFLRRDSISSSPASTSVATAPHRPTGMGEGALDILKRLDTNPAL